MPNPDRQSLLPALLPPAKPALPLSVVIVARNEAATLPRCLASVQGWVADIVVALNDTTDESEAVGKAFGARVEHLDWHGYRDTKNAALALAAHNWVLSLDADEEVSAPLRDAITAFAGDFDQYSAARFPRKVWFIDRWITHGDWYPDYSLRLFRRDRARAGAATNSSTRKSSATARSPRSAATCITIRSPRSRATSER